MKNQKKRPVNLDLTTIHFPVNAIVSILHRISGVTLFLSLPILFYFLHRSLASADDFATVERWLSFGGTKLLLWLLLTASVYHLFAGIRHIFMDFGFAEELKSMECTSWVVIGSVIIVSLLLGIWLW